MFSYILLRKRTVFKITATIITSEQCDLCICLLKECMNYFKINVRWRISIGVTLHLQLIRHESVTRYRSVTEMKVSQLI